MPRKKRSKILAAAENKAATVGRLIAESKPAKWMAENIAIRFVARMLLIAWYVVLDYIWWPTKRFVRRIYRYLLRHEVFAWTTTWVLCAILGVIILLDPIFLRLAGGAFVGVVFALISFRSPISGLIMWIFASPLLNVLIRFKFMEGTPIVTADRVCLAILLVIFLVQMKQNKKVEQNVPLHVCMFLFVFVMVIATFGSQNPKWSAQAVLDIYGAPMIVYLLARQWISDRKGLYFAFMAIMGVGIYFSAFGIPEHFLGHTIFKPTQWIERELETVRIQGPADSPTEFGIILVASLALAIAYFAHDRIPWKRVMYAAVICMMLVGIGLTLRRSVYVGTLVALLVMFACSGKSRKTTGTILLVGVLALVFQWQSLINSKFYSSRVADMGPVYSRAIIQATAWNIIKHNPVFGVGVDNFGAARNTYLSPYKDISVFHGNKLISPHNSFLRIMVEGGMLAFVPFALMIFFILLSSLRAYKRADNSAFLGRDSIIVFWAFSVAFLSQSFQGDAFWYCRYLNIVWFFLFGAIVGVHLKDKSMSESSGRAI